MVRFDSLDALIRTLLVAGAAYAATIVVLRVSGKRTLAKLNAFDFIVSVALGSVLASTLLSSDISWAQGLVAVATLVALQWVVAQLTRWEPARRAMTSAPTYLLLDGQLLPAALRRERIDPADLHQAVRRSGTGDLTQIGVVVLESSGDLSIIPASSMGSDSALTDCIQRPQDAPPRPDGS